MVSTEFDTSLCFQVYTGYIGIYPMQIRRGLLSVRQGLVRIGRTQAGRLTKTSL